MAAQAVNSLFLSPIAGVLLKAKDLEDVPYGSVPHGGNPDLSLPIVTLAIRSLN